MIDAQFSVAIATDEPGVGESSPEAILLPFVLFVATHAGQLYDCAMFELGHSL